MSVAVSRARGDPGPHPWRDLQAGSVWPQLPGGAVHVWRMSLEFPSTRSSPFAACLSADELDRMARYHFREDQLRYGMTRAALRHLLGAYSARDPTRLMFRYGSNGKPTLAPPGGGRGLAFNLSHSHRLVLFAVAGDREVGIDVEWVDNGVDCDAITGLGILTVSELCGLAACGSARGPARALDKEGGADEGYG